jgi:hypothetical protein
LPVSKFTQETSDRFSSHPDHLPNFFVRQADLETILALAMAGRPAQQ